eukprot:TRINITY_DN2271_c0_g1_i1.p1 TRINITY_DN2271_c0_g1~~TRINITY_DN2271_c0_g1_i1.p1  ORF type:complete len:396 (+),score=127.88 TRINITY_DN2271_c0_g1_i1:72-1259(+)
MARLLVVLVSAAAAAWAALPAEPPRFSWDTLPVFMHSYTNLSDAAAAAYFARFPLVTMAGYAGDGRCCAADPACCNEGRVAPFADAIKAVDDGVRVLYYQNMLINFPQTRLAHSVPESLLLHDAKGRLVYLGGCGATHAAPNHTVYDHAQPAMRALWAENVARVMGDANGTVDGVFCDRAGSIAEVAAKDLACYELSAAKLKAWDRGHWQAVADTQDLLTALSDKAVVVGNHAGPEPAMHLAKGTSWNGKMYEHFVPVRPYVPPGNQLRALERDAALIAEVHVDHCREGNALYAGSLAAFLIGATDHDYYACTEGWGYDAGWDAWPKDYSRPLGAPAGPAERLPHGVLRRRFASGTTAWLVEAEASPAAWGDSCIRWADGHVTGPPGGELCGRVQ